MALVKCKNRTSNIGAPSRVGNGKGYRLFGDRKNKLVSGPLNRQVERLAKKGVDAFAYLDKRYGIKDLDSFKNIDTKKISGMISDLAEIN